MGYVRGVQAALQRRWVWVAVFALLGVGCGAVLGLSGRPEYRASAQVSVIAPAASAGAGQESPRELATLAQDPAVTQPVLAQVAVPLTSNQLAARISTDVPSGTSVINVHVSDADAARAMELTNAVARQLAGFISSFVAPDGASASVSRAATGAPPAGRDWQLAMGIGLLLGLLVGGYVALWRDARRPSPAAGRPVAAGLPDLSLVWV